MKQAILVTTLITPALGVAAYAEVPKVATDIAPVQALVAQVMGGLGAPAVVVRPGASPHGYAMRPSEAGALQEADAVFWIGPALTPWLEGAIDTLAGGASVTPLLKAPGTTVLAFRTGNRFEPHEHEHEHEGQAHEDEDHDHDAHAHEGQDPHAWLDPRNAQVWLDVIAQRLGDIDPENAQTYLANAGVGRAEIAALEAELQQALGPVREVPFVVFHDALHYFEDRFGLAAVGAIALGDASDPGPARIQAVRQTVQEMGVTCVLSEPAFNPSLVQTVIEGSGARTGLVDPMGGGIAPGAAFYPALLRSVAAELVQCLE
ncbi:zinc ABC transporter substrate-binding protein [Roseovarius sp. M141]|nr:zinc ABC transporter substrate-binding protein [Roseovarius sp. M141]